jgi:hypothetical protein
MSKPPFLETAQKAINKYYPGYKCAFVAGSMLRGQETATSDIDIVVIYEDEFQDVHRQSVIEDGWPIEFFVHNKKANDYYMDKDRKRGMCIMMDMVANGIPLPEVNEMVKERQARARDMIDSGPPVLSEKEIEDCRYSITDSLDDLDENRSALERFGTLSNLYHQMGDLYLRGKGLWSGQGKSLGRLLRRADVNFSEEFEVAFEKAYQGDLLAVRNISEDVLNIYGGRLFEGYKRTAPEEWKNFRSEQEK